MNAGDSPSGDNLAELNTIVSHIKSLENPHSVTKAQLGLGSVDNTSDADKEVSGATQTKLDTINTKLDTIETNAKDDQLASEVPVTPVGNLASTDVQSALVELQTSSDNTNNTVQQLNNRTSNVDNTSDVSKPVSNPVATELSTKLDSSVYTASNVLAKVKTVDGSGSGLNADLLDGKQLTTIESEVDTKVALKLDKTGGNLTGALETTSTIDGRDVATDGTKLDTIESGAKGDQVASEVAVTPVGNLSSTNVQSALEELQVSANGTNSTVAQLSTSKLDASVYTASDVLSKLKTVDGTGSGLDADKVGGVSSTAIWSNTGQASGNYTTSGRVQAGRGKVGLTINDGSGNANLTFNHADGVPVRDGSSARIRASTDASTSVVDIQLGNNSLEGTSTALTTVLSLTTNGAKVLGNTVYHAGNTGSGSGLDADTLDGKELSELESDIAAKLPSVSYTAADVLTKLKTVDGVGSGLDADLLDGKHLTEILTDIDSLGHVTKYDTGAVTVVNPAGGNYRSDTPLQTGAIKVTLPNTWQSRMMTFELSIFDLVAGESFKMFVAGYDYSVSPNWRNVTAISTGAPDVNRQFKVRFGYSGGKTCFYIGELNSTWSYLQVNLDKVTVGLQSSNPASYRQGWDIGLETTAFEAETAVVDADQVGRTIGGNLIHHAGQDTGWLVPTLLNGWVAYNNGYGSDGVRYKRYPNGLVEVQGVVFSGASADVASLPVGFRPVNSVLTVQFSNSLLGRVDVRPSGFITARAPYSNIWLTVNFTFMAEQ
jgi:hypothetical protein